MVLVFDACFVIKEMMQEVTGRQTDIEAFVDSKQLFEVVAKDGGNNEKRFQIDIFDLKESYERGEITKLRWIPVATNPADALTKQSLIDNTPIWQLMIINHLDVDAFGWEKHSITHKRTVFVRPPIHRGIVLSL